MNFNLTEEQLMLRDGAERLMREAYDFQTRCKLTSEPQGFSSAMWQQFADLGWLGLSLPEDVGGLDCSFGETAVLLEAFGGAMVMEPYLHSSVFCGRIIDRSGNEALRQALLPRLIEGKLLVALADSEQGSRFRLGCDDVSTAKRSDQGYVLDCIKTLVPAGAAVDQLLVTARLDDSLAIFVVDAKAPGVKCHRYRLLDGSYAADIVMSDVATAHLLLADAMPVLEEAADRATMGAVAELLGVMEAVMKITSEYVKTRVQFGQPIGKFQALQHRMAEMFVEVQESRSILFYGMSCLDKDATQRRRATSAAKAVIGSAARFVCAQGIQLHGGIGMTDEYQVGHYYRKMTMLEKVFGDTDFHLNRFATTK